MTQKGLYSYEYMDSIEQFQEPQLPLKDAFYSLLTEEDISKTNNTHAQRVFNHFGMTELRDYHNFYLLSNLLLLAEAFQNLRNVCLQHYRLDSTHNYTSCGLLWLAAPKMMDVELDLLTDIDQHLFINERIRGEVAMINHW